MLDLILDFILNYLKNTKIGLDKILIFLVILALIHYLSNKKHKKDISSNIIEKYNKHNNDDGVAVAVAEVKAEEIELKNNIDKLSSMKIEDQVKMISEMILEKNNMYKMLYHGFKPLLKPKLLDIFLSLLSRNLEKLDNKNTELLLGTDLFNENKKFFGELNKFLKKDYKKRIDDFNLALNNENNKSENVTTDWYCVNSNDNYTPVRKNNGNIECMSLNAKDCLWDSRRNECRDKIIRKDSIKINPLVCGKEALNNKDHWCNIANNMK